MAKGPLGFGWMRLPLLSDKSTDFDFDQICKMVDCYLEAGFNYFDTSYVYHDGGSELAIKRCLVDRYPREKLFRDRLYLLTGQILQSLCTKQRNS